MDNAEWLEKERRLRTMMQRHGLEAILLGRSANVAWLSGGGRSYVNIATDGGVASLLITPHGRLSWLLCSSRRGRASYIGFERESNSLM